MTDGEPPGPDAADASGEGRNGGERRLNIGPAMTCRDNTRRDHPAPAPATERILRNRPARY